MKQVNIGDKYGQLEVIDIQKINKGHRVFLKCSCSEVFSVPKFAFTAGKYKRCKNCHCSWLIDRSHLIRDRGGEIHGKLTVVEMDTIRMSRNPGKGCYWTCKCECGNVVSINNSGFHSTKKITSCGCAKKGLQNNKKGFKDPVESSWNSIHNTYKKSALTRNLSFEISLGELKRLCSDKCFYCGCEPSNEYKLKSRNLSGERMRLSVIFYNGIDRIDNAKGYERENIVTCCKQCNYSKLTFSLCEFKSWIEKVYINLFKKTAE